MASAENRREDKSRGEEKEKRERLCGCVRYGCFIYLPVFQKGAEKPGWTVD